MPYSVKFDLKDRTLAYPCRPTNAYSPPAEWDPQFIPLVAKGNLKYLPPSWCNDDILEIPRLVDPPPLDCDAEIRDMLALQELRKFHPTIANEADGDPTSFIQAFLREIEAAGADLTQPIGKYTAQQHLERLATIVFLEAGCVAMNQKALFNRPRPYQLCPAIKPFFTDVPRHAAYPSGHSTQLHAIAYVIWNGLSGTRYGEAGAHLIDYVGAVARRREVAGLHYASDTVAGMSLAKRIADAYLVEETFIREYLDPVGQILGLRPDK
jgi:hypothetical protein